MGGDSEGNNGTFTDYQPRRSSRVMHPVLVVDDDAAIRSSVAEVLRDERFVVATAAGGREAVDVLRAGFRPAAIVLDLWMPEVNGEAALAFIRNTPSLARTPVIVLSADLEGATHETRARADVMLRKPVDLARLVDIVARVTPAVAGS